VEKIEQKASGVVRWGDVKRFWRVMAVLVLAVWSVCTVHCTVENLEGGTALGCCSDESGGSCEHPSGHCVCSAVSASTAVFQRTIHAAPAPAPMLCLFGAVKTTLSPLKTLPPWQFSYRAAVPPRAPSLIS
jgi:hypothetical protein